MATAWEQIGLESAWKMHQRDKAMQDIILTWIMVLEEERAKNRLEELIRARISDKQRALSLRMKELEEQAFLETFLEDREGLVVGDDRVETSSDWEQVEMDRLDEDLETDTDDKATKENTANELVKKTYLEETNLLSKRMVGTRKLKSR